MENIIVSILQVSRLMWKQVKVLEIVSCLPAKSLQSCPALCDPMDYIACQSPQSMGFSRQEYWSRLPCPPSGDLPNPGIEPRFPAVQVDSLPSEPPGKPKNTGVGSLSLQGILLTQELNQVSCIGGGFFTN